MPPGMFVVLPISHGADVITPANPRSHLELASSSGVSGLCFCPSPAPHGPDGKVDPEGAALSAG